MQDLDSDIQALTEELEKLKAVESELIQRNDKLDNVCMPPASCVFIRNTCMT